ncbi:hypothetical protein BJV77DRAFT_982392 [Russula vinacea]|nr:hypothetical protein BJV77DRAFT_982392 [Russula vinacea]
MLLILIPYFHIWMLLLRQISPGFCSGPTHPTPPKQRAWCSISILGFGMFHVCSVVHNLHLTSLVLVERSHARHLRK